jgi:hypothetical protein
VRWRTTSPTGACASASSNSKYASSDTGSQVRWLSVASSLPPSARRSTWGKGTSGCTTVTGRRSTPPTHTQILQSGHPLGVLQGGGPTMPFNGPPPNQRLTVPSTVQALTWTQLILDRLVRLEEMVRLPSSTSTTAISVTPRGWSASPKEVPGDARGDVAVQREMKSAVKRNTQNSHTRTQRERERKPVVRLSCYTLPLLRPQARTPNRGIRRCLSYVLNNPRESSNESRSSLLIIILNTPRRLALEAPTKSTR